MNDATLERFRSIASTMAGAPTDWQWIGPHMSQRMFGITEERAKGYADRFGGEAKQMSDREAEFRAWMAEGEAKFRASLAD